MLQTQARKYCLMKAVLFLVFCQTIYVLHLQNDFCVGMDDDDIISQIPSIYWLKGAKTKCLLVCMVHRLNKDIAAICSSLPSGQTKAIQCSNAAARVAKE